MKLSKNFSLRELTRSSVGDRHGIQNLPDQDQLVCLTALCSCILQPIRNVHGRVNINSGLRVIELNRIITGSDKDTSQHIRGQTSDIECPGISNLDLAKWVQENLELDQGILECYTRGDPSSGWVHVSYRPDGENRNRWLTASRVDGEMKYEEGINA